MSESQEPQTKLVPEKASEQPEASPPAAEPAKPSETAPVEITAAAGDAAATEPAQAPKSRGLPSYLAQAAAVLAALGIGWAGGHATTAMKRPAANPAHEAMLAVDWTGLASGLQGDTMRMAADLQALKGALAGLKEAGERSKQETAGRFGQLAERLDRIRAADQEAGAKLAAITERLEKAEREATVRLASASERLDRAERPAAQPATAEAAPAPKALLEAALQPPPAATPPAPAADPGLRTGSIPDQRAEAAKSEQPKSEAKAAPIEGWVLREVYDGVALIEGRNRRLLEIAPGQSLSGIGRVESIERRGRSWVVVTTRGVITSQPW